MRKKLLAVLLFSVFLTTTANNYSFDVLHQYQVEQIRVSENGSRFLKVWGKGSNADKAISQALQDAVACCIFVGIDAANSTTGHNASAVPSLCPEGASAYQKHKKYFDNFFSSGDFLLYVSNANSRYPSGENNVKIKGGRRVGVYVELKVKQLRKRLEDDGIIKSLENIFDNISEQNINE